MFNNFFKKLTFKHTLITISVIFITGSILSFFQIIYDISLTREKVKNDIKRLVKITEESAAQSLYHLDVVQAEKLIKGYIKHSPVINATLTDNFGITLYSETQSKNQKMFLLDFFFKDKTENYNFDLFYSPANSDPISVGRLEIQTDYSTAYKEFKQRASFIAVSNIIQQIFLGIFIALIFYRTLTRPIVELSQQISAIDPTLPEGHNIKVSKRHKNDEMGSLANSINMILHEYSELNRELEKRVLERTYAVQKANKRLKNSLNQLKNAKDKLVESEKMASLGGLVAGVSHEVNTPVGNSVTAASYLYGKLENLKKKILTENLDDQELKSFIASSDEAVDIILKNLEKASNLVSSFKQIAVDQTYAAMRIFEFKKHIDDTLLSLKPKYKGLDITINVNCPRDLFIFHDPGIFYQILSNLVINSIIHGFEENQKKIINIEVEADNENMTIKYKDNGKGIDEKLHKKIFEPFFTTSKKQGGTGLGMYIVYNLVTQKLSGSIECLSPENSKGAYFFMSFPLPRE
jgi:signal transduction histidine kinase